MNNELSREAKIALAMGLGEVRGLRACALVVVSRAYMVEKQHGRTPDSELAERVARRFRLSDYLAALRLAP